MTVMLYRSGLLLLGLFFLALGALGAYVVHEGDGVVHSIMEGARAVLFAVIGFAMVAAAARWSPCGCEMILKDVLRDTFPRRNLIEFAAFWAVVAVAVGIMLVLRS